MLTPLGVIFLCGGLFALAFRPRALVLVLAAAAPFPASAAIVAGTNGFPPFYLIAALMLLRLPIGKRPNGRPVTRTRIFKLLLAFTVAAFVSVFVAWALFQGTPVLVAREGIDEQVVRPGLLTIGTSNYAQLIYLVLGVAVVYYGVAFNRLGWGVVGVAASVGTFLSTLRYVVGETLPWDVIDNWPGIDYAMRLYDGGQRFRGVFPEPSYLAVFSLAAGTFFAVLLLESPRGRVKVLALAGLACAAGNGAVAYSGTATLGAITVAGVALLALMWGLGRGSKIPVGVMLPVLTVVFVLVASSGSWWPRVSAVLAEKSTSQSATNRFAADQFSLDLLWSTWGLGAGLGSSRPSSFATMLFSNVGIVGFALFITVLATALRLLWQGPGLRSVWWALVATLIAKVIAEPSLSLPMLWLLLMVAASQSDRPDAKSGIREDGSGELSAVTVERGLDGKWGLTAASLREDRPERRKRFPVGVPPKVTRDGLAVVSCALDYPAQSWRATRSARAASPARG